MSRWRRLHWRIPVIIVLSLGDHPVEVHADELGTYRIDVNVEFCPRRPVAKSLALSMHLSHGGVAESTSNCSAHDGKTCNVLCQFRVDGE